MPPPRLEEFLRAEDIAALERPTGEAHGLPGRAYGEDFFAIEQTRLFPRTWAAVGFGADVPGKGDAHPVELAGWPLVLVRGGDGEVRVFHNICRHRGMRVVPGPCRHLRTMRCPWHGWTYDLTGRLVATPNLGGEGVPTAPGFEPAELGLKPVRVARWLDYVFVNIDGVAPPFADVVAPVQKLLRGFDLAGLAYAGSWEGSYPGNWKVAVEGAIEDYHLPWGHPELLKGVSSRNPMTHLEGAMAVVSARVAMGADAPAAPIRAYALPRIPYGGNGEADRSFIVNLFPTAVFVLIADHLMLSTFLPDGPDATRLDFRFYVAGDAATAPSFAEARQGVIDGWAYVANQDIPFVRGVHANNRLRDALDLPVRFSPFWEGAAHHFQRNVAAMLRTGRTIG